MTNNCIYNNGSLYLAPALGRCRNTEVGPLYAKDGFVSLWEQAILMSKDFDGWNERKKKINEITNRQFFKEGEVWWVHLGLNIGYEIDGKGTEYERPVVVIKKYNQYSFLALPLSTVNKSNIHYVSIGVIGGKENYGIMSQLRNIDSKRLINQIGEVDSALLKIIKEKISQTNFG